MNSNAAAHSNIAIKLPKVSLKALLATIRKVKNGDRILVSPQSVDEKLLLKTYGFQFSEENIDGVIYRFCPTRNKSIETISSIIYEDSKVTTYKIALLRALVDISSGLHNEHVLYDSEDGTDYAYIPYGLVCYQWIKYYWALIEQDIPQIGRNTYLEFEKPLRSLIASAQRHYVLSPQTQYLDDFKIGFPNDSELERLTSEVMSKLRNAIKNGPVRYAGNKETFSSTNRFSYTRSTKNLYGLSDYINSKGCIRLKLNLFFEMQVFGNILSDAIAIKWAQESVRLSEKRDYQITLQKVLPYLLTDIFEDRDQSQAREIARRLLQKENSLTCVYSGKKLGKQFAMDHILPYSIFFNNDLWNLVPSAPTVNNKKSDKMISLDALNTSRKRLLEYWDYVAETRDKVFASELRSTLKIDTKSASWHTQLFDAVARQAEVTAQHRGLSRWNF
ncbi:MAG: HNH endonuclease domain-containing protein [Halodesulfovibrio sp.]|uniref:HNH endonuclease domain-containing protein n=1 Tax=Halodesulfovibrio sp. TaxID=1912772 RepID=UPI00359D7DC3